MEVHMRNMVEEQRECLKRIRACLSAVCMVMVFTAQAYPPQEKKINQTNQANKTQRIEFSRPAAGHNVPSRTASQPQRLNPVQSSRPQNRRAPQVQTSRQAFDNKNRQIVQFHREPATPMVHQAPATRAQAQRFDSHPVQRSWTESRIFATPAVPVDQENRSFHHRHHNHWQPRYNFYDNQYHFYPYVDIATIMELTSTGVLIQFNGQNYYYDQGTFYLQDQSGQYAAVPPPLGITVNALPPNARQINIDGGLYYRYKGVFYVQTDQGYQVVGPVMPVPSY